MGGGSLGFLDAAAGEASDCFDPGLRGLLVACAASLIASSGLRIGSGGG
jgi:hypothetical protein